MQQQQNKTKPTTPGILTASGMSRMQYRSGESPPAHSTGIRKEGRWCSDAGTVFGGDGFMLSANMKGTLMQKVIL